jgi:hypothetical protein
MTVPAISSRVMRAVRVAAGDEVSAGAMAVVLVGSYVRGEASPESDVDIVSLWRREPPLDTASAGSTALDDWRYELRRSGSLLLSISRTTPAAVRAKFRDPARACTAVPGWREALIVEDATGVAARLQGQAQQWTWSEISAAADAYVASELTWLAEEIHKLVNALASADDWAAAGWASFLAVRMASVMAIRKRILYGSENRMWEMVADASGGQWRRSQASALGLRGEAMRQRARAALRLYRLAVSEAEPLFDARQRAVVRHAVRLIEHVS